jgi:hemerythrin-like domain-containing protein
MTDPLHMLKHEHRVIEQALHALDGICLKLTWGERLPPGPLSELIDFIQNYADRFHHAKEEDYLFSALQEGGILHDSDEIGAILREHQVENALVNELAAAVDRYCRGDEDAGTDLINAGRKYSSLLIAHMRKEDNILFRIADGMLDESAKQAMSAGFREAAKQLGESRLKRYERTAFELEANWSV